MQSTEDSRRSSLDFNPLHAELNPICHLLALLGAHHILHVNRIRVNFAHPEYRRDSSVSIVTELRAGQPRNIYIYIYIILPAVARDYLHL